MPTPNNQRIDLSRPNMEPRAGDSYLQATVHSASPARLRLMLINRGIEISKSIEQQWRQATIDTNRSVGDVLKLMDILCELLNGITGSKNESENEACQTVADLYVFLTKHLLAAEETHDADALNEIVSVLQIESETWQQVCATETLTHTKKTTGSVSFSA